jgi:uncharacterized protein YciI
VTAAAGRDFLYVLRPARPAMLTEGLTDREREAVADHLTYLRRLAADGVMTLFGRTDTTDERTFGLVVFRAPSEEAACRLMGDDPAVARGVMTAELFPYRVAYVRGDP